MNNFRSILGLAIVAVLVSASLTSAAQYPFGRGSVLIGGGGTYMSISSDDFRDDPSLFVFYPTMGYFLTDNLCLGAQLILASVSDGGDDISAMGIGPQATYYITKSRTDGGYSGRAVPYLTASLLIGQISSGNEETSARAVTIGGGVLAMMAKNIGGYAEVNYSFDKLSEDDELFNEDYSGTRIAAVVGLRMFLW